MDDFNWPWQYNFPPFFTIQPNAATREKQLEVWCQLSIDFFKCKKIFKVNIHELASSPLFRNSVINRKLAFDGIEQVFGELEKRGRVEWIDRKKGTCFVYPTRLEELAETILHWVDDTSRSNAVCTFGEITDDEANAALPFFGLDKEVLLKALRILESKAKAEVMLFEGHEGVKFF
jgi:ESCRT-II complex subunit VPS25